MSALLLLAWDGTAHARWYVYGDCPADWVGESTFAVWTYEECVELLPSYQERYPTCSWSCQVEGSDGEIVGGMAASVATGVAEVFSGVGLRSYDPGRDGWPYGRSAISVEALNVGVGVADGARLAMGPTTVMLRAYRPVSVGAFAAFLIPGETSDGSDATLLGYGGALRLALKAGAFGVKEKRDHGGYYELYIDAGYGRATHDVYGGRGELYSAGAGLLVTTGWMIGVGLSTRYMYGEVEGATDLDGNPLDISIRGWDALVAQLVIGL